MTGALRLGTAAVEVETRSDGVCVRNREPLEAYPDALVERLEHWAAETPDRVFLAERDAGAGWREVSYGAALHDVRSLAQALLDRGLSAERPLAILSENAVDHGLLGLAAQYAGIPHAPISTAYSLVSTDFAKLRDVIGQVRPGLVYASDGPRYARAIEAAVPAGVEIVTSGPAPPHRAASAFADLLATRATAAVDAARTRVVPDSIAKILFTSGSTGSPKGVINTQRMLCSNQQMIRQAFPFVADDPPVIVDWLPWNHTFGGNHNVGIVLHNGGTLLINAGKPGSPAAFEATLANLREIAPTIHFDVPRGFEMLLAALRAEPALRERFFSRLQMLFYAGAAIAPHVWDGLQELAREATGTGVFITTSLGSTETAPAAISATWQADGPGFIGIPLPGVEAKLVPAGAKRELRLRGPNITPGYWRNERLTAAAFDDDGFYTIGDAVRWADEREPARGFVFDGRLSEDFKLATGTWVSVGTLRLRVLGALAPLVSDVVVSGENQDQIAVLLFPDLERLRALGGLPRDAHTAAVFAHDAVRSKIGERLAELAATSSGSATRVERAVLLDEPPSLDAGEITDKGSLNQRAVLARRAALVADAHRTPPPRHVMTLDARDGAGTPRRR
jgi:feruloyl-CoA synthase